MIVSNRQRRILEMLLHRREATASEIAEEVQISARTVHRDLREIKALLSDYGLSLMTKSGKGITIEGADEATRQFQKMLAHFETVAYASEERKTLIQCRLLEENEPLKLFTLAYELHAAVPTVTRDLDEIGPHLGKYGLELIRRRGYGVEIEGHEAGKRALIEWLAEQFLDESDLFGPASEAEHAWPVTRKLLQMVGKEHFLTIERMVWGLEEKSPSRLSESAYTRLLLRLSIAVARMKGGHWLGSADGEGERESVLHPYLEPFLSTFPWEWPNSERASVIGLLSSASAEAEKQQELLLHQHGAAAADAAWRLIRSVGMRMNVPLGEDQSLLEGLAHHLAPAMERMRKKETIRNPLLPQIKKDFAELFDILQDAAREQLTGIEVPEEELGYMVMHFGASLERLHVSRPVRAMIVCTSGIGSSRLLAVRIEKQFPQIEFIGNYSWYEASRVPKERYELIISTVDLPIEPERYVKISPLLTMEETEKLRVFLERLPVNRRTEEEGKSKDASGWERMKRISDYTTAVVDVLAPFAVHRLRGLAGQPAGLGAVIDRILLTLSLSEDAHASVQHRLIEREKAGSQAIAGTKLALFHTRSEHIEKPVLRLYNLDEPLWLGEDGSAEVRQVLLMLAPQQLSRPMLEVLSEISALLLQQEFVELLEQGDSEVIKPYISQELESFIQSKWRGREEP
ncbi:BglG family transcription antiterminator [Paenibacillus soyae]|uniref:BglG family transcription antiterminator n=1 Tax=Paenibacillus soyae TaxID=2969249 RepID=A0A9X2N252_9BACL|nr:BglG family transcription antiterminator [Paenibacillus soyae]MCR2807657.1 BglG family transcription antiterminator [Paenibacillus soyae]